LDGHSGEEPDDLLPGLEETLPLIQHGGGDSGGGGSCGGGDGGSCGGRCGGGDGGSCGGGDGGSCGGGNGGGGSCGGDGGSCGGGGSCSGGDGGGGDTFLNLTIPLARREDPAQPNSVLNLVPQSQSTASRGGGETRPPSGETRPPSGETRPPSGETRPPPSGVSEEDPVQDTVGVVVVDRLGHVASSVSSGGIGKLGSHQF
jgi:hypothetical protein